MSDVRARLKDKKRIVVKIGSSSLMYGRYWDYLTLVK